MEIKMINLQITTPAHQAALDYTLDDVQTQFTALPSLWFDDDTATHRRITILQHDEPVGFFVLDSGIDRAGYSDNRNALLLRSMSVAPAHQSKGIARAALAAEVLHPLARAEFPQADEIVLGVNHANVAAIALYRTCGFADTGKTYMSLRSLQYIFSRPL